jgi:hypothetical protein
MSRSARIGAVLLVLSIAGLIAIGVAKIPAPEPGRISLGPFDEEVSCLEVGNQGVTDDEWTVDYECVGGPGAWYIDAVPEQPPRWGDTGTGMAVILLGGSALTSAFWIGLALLLPGVRFPGFDNDSASSSGDGGGDTGGGDTGGGDSGGGGD